MATSDNSFEDKISKNLPDLVSSIVAKDDTQLWNVLVKKGIMLRDDMKFIKEEHNTNREQVQEMLNWMCRRPPSDHKLFLEALQETNQTKALLILGYNAELKELTDSEQQAALQQLASSEAATPVCADVIQKEKTGSKPIIIENFEEKISSNMPELVTNITARDDTHLWNKLVQKGIMLNDDVTHLKEKNKTNREQVQVLLNWMYRRPPSDHQPFLEALQETNQVKVLLLLGYDEELKLLTAKEQKVALQQHAAGDTTSVCACATQEEINGSKRIVIENFEDKITVHMPELVSLINANQTPLWNILVKKGVMLRDDVTHLKEKYKSNRAHVEELLKWMVKRPVSDHQPFLEALQETNQNKVLLILGYDEKLRPLGVASNESQQSSTYPNPPEMMDVQSDDIQQSPPADTSGEKKPQANLKRPAENRDEIDASYPKRKKGEEAQGALDGTEETPGGQGDLKRADIRAKRLEKFGGGEIEKEKTQKPDEGHSEEVVVLSMCSNQQ